jgi:hypothetical protein
LSPFLECVGVVEVDTRLCQALRQSLREEGSLLDVLVNIALFILSHPARASA